MDMTWIACCGLLGLCVICWTACSCFSRWLDHRERIALNSHPYADDAEADD